MAPRPTSPSERRPCSAVTQRCGDSYALDDHGLMTRKSRHLYDDSAIFLWTQETKRLFSDLMNKCGDPTCAQRGSPDDPNVLLVKKAVDSINNRRATWLRVRAKAKARGKS